MLFIETKAFTKELPSHLDDEGYRELQNALMERPDAGDVIRGTGGIRKLRWADARRRKGKRGGLRIIYYHYVAANHCWMLAIYDKNIPDLTSEEREVLRKLIVEITRRRSI